MKNNKMPAALKNDKVVKDGITAQEAWRQLDQWLVFLQTTKAMSDYVNRALQQTVTTGFMALRSYAMNENGADGFARAITALNNIDRISRKYVQ